MILHFDEAIHNALPPPPIPNFARQQKTKILKCRLFEAQKLETGDKIISDNKKEFKIIDTQCTDFLSQPLVSLGEQIFNSNCREGIILDSSSETLNACYMAVNLACIRQKLNNLQTLQILLPFLRGLFKSSETSKINIAVESCYIDSITPKSGGTPCKLVPLQAFIAAEAGVCRHHALLACYIIHRLIQDNLLNAKEVHHVRGHLDTGHSWVMIKDREGQWIHFDSQLDCIIKIDSETIEFLRGKYSRAAIDAVMEKLNQDQENDMSKTQSMEFNF